MTITKIILLHEIQHKKSVLARIRGQIILINPYYSRFFIDLEKWKGFCSELKLAGVDLHPVKRLLKMQHLGE